MLNTQNSRNKNKTFEKWDISPIQRRILKRKWNNVFNVTLCTFITMYN
jgi:hypothetical protein